MDSGGWFSVVSGPISRSSTARKHQYCRNQFSRSRRAYQRLLGPDVLGGKYPIYCEAYLFWSELYATRRLTRSVAGHTQFEYTGGVLLPMVFNSAPVPNPFPSSVRFWWLSALRKHKLTRDSLRYTIAGTGYILTEFVQPVGYAQALNTIDAAGGHQIDEARWLRSKF